MPLPTYAMSFFIFNLLLKHWDYTQGSVLCSLPHLHAPVPCMHRLTAYNTGLMTLLCLRLVCSTRSYPKADRSHRLFQLHISRIASPSLLEAIAAGQRMLPLLFYSQSFSSITGSASFPSPKYISFPLNLSLPESKRSSFLFCWCIL